MIFLQNIYTFLTNINSKDNHLYYEIIDDDDFCECGLCNFMKKYISPILMFFIYKIKYE